MSYQVGDLINGPYGDIYQTLADAEKALAECIAEGKALNMEQGGQETDTSGEPVETFFFIVDSTGAEI